MGLFFMGYPDRKSNLNKKADKSKVEVEVELLIIQR
jgi:hypothetical protein